jgi:hypothetical protein
VDFRRKAQVAAEAVQLGLITQAEAEQKLGLEPGQRLCPNGVISGSGAHPDIPRHGAGETDGLYGACNHPAGDQYGPADMTMYDQSRPDE